MSWVAILILLVSGCADGNAPEEESQTREALSFVEVTEEIGLGDFKHNSGSEGEKWYPETVGAGVGFMDFDKDGWLDLLVVEGGLWKDRGSAFEGRTPPVHLPKNSLRLYRNTGEGNFEDYTRAAGLHTVQTYGFGVSIGDYDNDRDEDFFLTTLYENLLFRNDDGRFVEVGNEAGVSDKSLWSSASLFFDADNDGWLDLYVGNYVEWSPDTDIWCTHNGTEKSYCAPSLYEGVPGLFYKNNGDGTFSEVADQIGLGGAPGKTLGVVEMDFNSDGFSDLVVANDTQRDLLYQNNGDGTFEEIGLTSGIAFDENGVARAGMGVDAGDVDNNGKVSVFVANYSQEMIGVYRHQDEGVFVNRSAASQIGRPSLTTLGFGLFLFDPNLDGYLDLFVANGHVDDMIEQVQDNVTYRQAPQLFVNKKNGTFEEAVIEDSGLLTQKVIGRGAAFGDWDRDGDQDIVMIENNGPAFLWENTGIAGNALRVYVSGTQSNASGIGTEVKAYVAGQPQVRRIRSGGSFLSQSERVATIGLGIHSKVDSLFVSWPSGIVDRFEEVPGGQAILVNEEAPAYQSLYVFNRLK